MSLTFKEKLDFIVFNYDNVRIRRRWNDHMFIYYIIDETTGELLYVCWYDAGKYYLMIDIENERGYIINKMKPILNEIINLLDDKMNKHSVGNTSLKSSPKI